MWFILKCINVTFNTIDDAEFAMSTLKNEFEFSYSLISDLNNESDVEHDNNKPFIFANFYNYNNSNFISPYAPMTTFAPYPVSADSIDIGIDNPKTVSDVVFRIKCKDAFSNVIRNRLINLNGRHIKII